jgi:hypothetical protein
VKVLITGGRDWEDQYAVDVIVAGLACLLGGANEQFELIHGDCPTGADSMADTWKDVVNVTPFPADWDLHKKAAGPIRNRQMLDQEPDLVVAFSDHLPTSKGTRDCVTEARRRAIPVWHLAHVE